jgi:hypothetical protein
LFIDEGYLAEKIREVVERLVKHEHETVEVRAEAAGAEARSEALLERLIFPYMFDFSGLIGYRNRLDQVNKVLAQREMEVEEMVGMRDAYVSPSFFHHQY